MKTLSLRSFRLSLAVLGFLLVATAVLPAQVLAQRPPARVTRTYVPPADLVNFPPTTSFVDFITVLNPIVKRVEGKQIIDPEGRTFAIGVPVANMYYFDAFQQVLATHGLTYTETEEVILIQAATAAEGVPTVGSPLTSGPANDTSVINALVNAQTREIQIDAMVFQVNLTDARQLGVDWNVFFGGSQGGAGGQTGSLGGGTGNDTEGETRFLINTKSIANIVGENVVLPSTIDIGTLTRFFRLLESEGVGETLSQPSIVVRSGQQGTLQDGEDFPVITRDIAGNSNTTFVPTGIIISVTPTFLDVPLDSTLATRYNTDSVEFVELEVKVERSNGRPFGESVSISRNQVSTKVLMLDGEQQVIGGLYSKDVTNFRRGIPLLKEIPLLKYLFSYETTQETRKELIVVIRATLLDPLYVRQGQQRTVDALERARQELRQRLDVMGADKVFGTKPAQTRKNK